MLKRKALQDSFREGIHQSISTAATACMFTNRELRGNGETIFDPMLPASWEIHEIMFARLREILTVLSGPPVKHPGDQSDLPSLPGPSTSYTGCCHIPIS